MRRRPRPAPDLAAMAAAMLRSLAERVTEWRGLADIESFRPALDEAAEEYGAALEALAGELETGNGPDEALRGLAIAQDHLHAELASAARNAARLAQ